MVERLSSTGSLFRSISGSPTFLSRYSSRDRDYEWRQSSGAPMTTDLGELEKVFALTGRLPDQNFIGEATNLETARLLSHLSTGGFAFPSPVRHTSSTQSQGGQGGQVGQGAQGQGPQGGQGSQGQGSDDIGQQMLLLRRESAESLLELATEGLARASSGDPHKSHIGIPAAAAGVPGIPGIPGVPGVPLSSSILDDKGPADLPDIPDLPDDEYVPTVFDPKPAKRGVYTREERALRIERYRQKKMRRSFKKKILYTCRKSFADQRPRVGGRFVSLSKVKAEEGASGASPTSTPRSGPASGSASANHHHQQQQQQSQQQQQQQQRASAPPVQLHSNGHQTQPFSPPSPFAGELMAQLMRQLMMVQQEQAGVAPHHHQVQAQVAVPRPMALPVSTLREAAKT